MMIGQLLQRFCDTDGQLSESFVKGGWRYFTDGHAMIRLPAEGCLDSEELPRRPKKPEDIFKGFDSAKRWKPWPAGEPCDQCGNARYVTKKCADCNGSGTCRLCGDGECHECDGTGEEKRTCECAKVVSAQHPGNVSQYFVWLIAQLGEVEWSTTHKSHCVFFRWPEGQGAVAKIGPDW